MAKKDNEEFIVLENNNGQSMKFEILDVIYKDDDEYVVLLPEDSEDEVVIYQVISLDDDSDEAHYFEVTDDALADEIFNEFVKRMSEEG